MQRINQGSENTKLYQKTQMSAKQINERVSSIKNFYIHHKVCIYCNCEIKYLFTTLGEGV
jgi:hypothetical protein